MTDVTGKDEKTLYPTDSFDDEDISPLPPPLPPLDINSLFAVRSFPPVEVVHKGEKKLVSVKCNKYPCRKCGMPCNSMYKSRCDYPENYEKCQKFYKIVKKANKEYNGEISPFWLNCTQCIICDYSIVRKDGQCVNGCDYQELQTLALEAMGV